MKYLPYGRQSIDKADIEAVAAVLRSDFITQGPRINDFEDALCKYGGAKYAVAVSSGTAALHIACLAAGIKAGSEAITSPITFAASANCILYCAGKPIFADIQADTANIDPRQISKQISRRTKTLIPVHFAGHPCDLDEIYNIAKRYNLVVIEDAAHALGAEYKGERIGSCSYSDMAIFSFHPVKHITTGEGGAVLTNNKNLYEQLLLLRNHGITKNVSRSKKADGLWYYEMQKLGFNYRITDFQCALGISQLKRIDKFLIRRREIARIYNTELNGLNGLLLPVEKQGMASSWHLYAIRIRNKADINRKKIFNYLRKYGIGAQVHYIPVYLHPYYQKLGYKRGLCPSAERFYSEEISLPLHPSMSNQQVKITIDTVKKYFHKKELF